MRERTRSAASIAVALLAIAASNSSWAQEAGTYIYSNGKRVAVTIQKNRLGVVIREGTKNGKEFLQSTARNTKLQLTKFDPSGISVFSSRDDVPVSELEDLARTLTDTRPVKEKPASANAEDEKQKEEDQAASDPAPIRHAGLLVLTKGATEPFLVTADFVVQFKKGIASATATALIEKEGIEIVRQSRFGRKSYLLRSPRGSKLGFFGAPLRFHEMPEVEFAHPNIVQRVQLRESIPNDPRFGKQWHHRNTGQKGGLADADIDTDLAWDITRGNKNLVIAVIDNGFVASHEDLLGNLWENPGEIPGDGIDNDVNGLVDDVHGWNFDDNSANLAGGDHGTKVAGCLAARGNNGLGVSGTCQECQLMMLRYPIDQLGIAETISYAYEFGAEIINNSWGYPAGTVITAVLRQSIDDAATIGRGGKGALIFFAVTNSNRDSCDPTMETELSALPKVIAVSGASNCDRFVETGYGNCVDLLGPTWNNNIDTGKITTTLPGGDGYTDFFAKNSAATPIVAGIAGLVLDVAPHLSRLQVQRVLQDTADRIEKSAANYDAGNGFSLAATHACGRVNAFEAVRLVASDSAGGCGGVDVFLRDNELDWGNTEQPSNVLFESVTDCGPRGYIPHWNSVDIKVDAPPFQPIPTSSVLFESLSDEQPASGVTNRVFVRVRNRGPSLAESVTIKLHWATAGISLPPLPSDFWTQFPNDPSSTIDWHPIGTQVIENLGYSGSSVANSAMDAAQIVMFDWLVPATGAAAASPAAHCLLAIADGPQDPLSSETTSSLIVNDITPNDNNVAYRNVFVQDLMPGVSAFVLRNASRRPVRSRVEVSGPSGWRFELVGAPLDEPFSLKKNATRRITLRWKPSGSEQGTIDILHYSEKRKKNRKIIGGMTIAVGEPGLDCGVAGKTGSAGVGEP